ncbi:hypothetical protein [Agrobacterium cavarae]|uniref:hypothetical protein n=1 Tax=Agrobacterium cavarae TaxID=2528239 RepID=UPI002899A93F|nr:hypothetical protein [Agrobacterium cavarae]
MVYQMKKRAAVRPQPALPYSIQAPVRGLILNEPLARAKPGGALVLENFVPTSTGVRTRGGSLKTATIGGSVKRLWTFKSGQVDELFASDDEHIYKISNVIDAVTIPAAAVSEQTNGYYSIAQFGTAGGNFLYAVNGADDAQLYDGDTWKRINTLSTPAITGIATASFSFVWSFANRLFFVEEGTMNAWFLPIDSIGGAAQVFSLAGLFQEGGSLLYGGKWSMDAGDGLDDKCVFVSTEGEVAVFQGTNPGSRDANNWQKVGVYKITAPMGPNATMQAGGDFLMGVEDGIVPISQAVNKDAAALSLSAVSRNIEPAWKKEVGIRGARPWEIMKWPSNNMMVVSLPADEGVPTLCFVANLETGAWTTFTGWDIQCMAHYNGAGYFGTKAGTIHRMEETGSDDGMPFTCTMVCLPDQLKSPGVYKTVESARATFLANIPFNPKISASVDYKTKLPTPPSSAMNTSNDLWDRGKWDQAKFDAGSSLNVFTRWLSMGVSGFAISPQVQITSGTSLALKAELIQIDLLYRLGQVMV